jgi:hypothetical protein
MSSLADFEQKFCYYKDQINALLVPQPVAAVSSFASSSSSGTSQPVVPPPPSSSKVEIVRGTLDPFALLEAPPLFVRKFLRSGLLPASKIISPDFSAPWGSISAAASVLASVLAASASASVWAPAIKVRTVPGTSAGLSLLRDSDPCPPRPSSAPPPRSAVVSSWLDSSLAEGVLHRYRKHCDDWCSFAASHQVLALPPTSLLWSDSFPTWQRLLVLSI